MEERTSKLLQKRTARLQNLMQSFLVQHQAVHSRGGTAAQETTKPSLEGKGEHDNAGYEATETGEGDNKTDSVGTPSLESILESAEKAVPSKPPPTDRRGSTTSITGRRKSIMDTVAAKILPERLHSDHSPSVRHDRKMSVMNAMSKILPNVVAERQQAHACHHHPTSDTMQIEGDCCKELRTLAVLVDKVERLLEITKGDWNEISETEHDKTNKINEESEDGRGASTSSSSSARMSDATTIPIEEPEDDPVDAATNDANDIKEKTLEINEDKPSSSEIEMSEKL